MHLLFIDEAFAPGLTKTFGVNYMWIEVNREGFIERELGFSKEGETVHRYPGNGRFGQYGIFDMNKFDVSSLRKDDIDPEQFDEAWRRGSDSV